MKTVDQLCQDIIEREGGYVNDPDDPGGATNFGVTIHTMRRLGVDLDQDGDIDSQDVRKLSKAQAADIYKKYYFERPKIAKLPEPIQASVFDMYVNAGGNAVKLLQRILNRFGRNISVDGGIGPQTITAAQDVYRAAGHYFIDAYAIERRNYYYDLAERRPASRKYAKSRNGGKGGWIKRAEEFMSKGYHYSLNDHNRRTKSWG